GFARPLAAADRCQVQENKPSDAVVDYGLGNPRRIACPLGTRGCDWLARAQIEREDELVPARELAELRKPLGMRTRLQSDNEVIDTACLQFEKALPIADTGIYPQP